MSKKNELLMHDLSCAKQGLVEIKYGKTKKISILECFVALTGQDNWEIKISHIRGVN